MSFFKAIRKTRKNGVFFQLIVCYTKVVHLHGFFLFHKMQSSVDIFIFQMVFFIYIVDYNERDENRIGHLFFYIQFSSSVNNEVCSLHQWPDKVSSRGMYMKSSQRTISKYALRCMFHF